MANINEFAFGSGKMVNSNGDIVNLADAIDNVRNSMTSIATFIRMMFEGKVFIGFKRYAIISGGTAYAQIKTGANGVCFILDAIATDAEKVAIKVYEAPTVTDGTTQITLVNRNRESATTATVTAYSDPSGISGGTQIEEYYAGGTSGPIITGGEQLGGQLPLRLKANTDYVIEITNEGTADADALIRFSIIED